MSKWNPSPSVTKCHLWPIPPRAWRFLWATPGVRFLLAWRAADSSWHHWYGQRSVQRDRQDGRLCRHGAVPMLIRRMNLREHGAGRRDEITPLNRGNGRGFVGACSRRLVGSCATQAAFRMGGVWNALCSFFCRLYEMIPNVLFDVSQAHRDKMTISTRSNLRSCMI